MMPYMLPSGVTATAIKCPNCGREIARFFKKEKRLGIPVRKCKKCGTEVFLENYIPWQMMSQNQKAGEIFSLIFRSVVLGVTLGGLIGAVLLFIIILIFRGDLSEFPLITYYVFTTLLPVLFFVIRPWFNFYRIFKHGNKWIKRMKFRRV